MRTLRVVTLALAAAAAPGVGCLVTSCFVAGTRIATPRGERPIETLRVGDEVLAWSLAEARTVVRRVRGLHRATSREVRRLTIDGIERCAVTLEHPFWVVSRGWVPVRELREGDRVLAIHGDRTRELPIQAIAAEEHATPDIEVFNLTVEEPESCYFADGILVHNKSPAMPTCEDPTYSAPEVLSGTATGARMRVQISIPKASAGSSSVVIAVRVLLGSQQLPSSLEPRAEREWLVEFEVPWGAQATVEVSGTVTDANGRSCPFAKTFFATAPQADAGVEAGASLDGAPDGPADAAEDAPSTD